jgi:dTDP-4-dehydrorhamnose reductase
MKNKMRIAILGNGYIGNILQQELSNNFQVLLLGRDVMDYHDPLILRDFVVSNSIDLVIGSFGFTGKPNIDEAETKKRECWNLNVQIPLYVNLVCVELGVPFVHISSGCIFDGYAKEWNEADEPNFGVFDRSSFYSNTKHAFELITKDLPGTILRIRMPFSSKLESRNLISKLYKYDNVIDFKNSKTCIEDLSGSIIEMINSGMILNVEGKRIFHMTNTNPLMTHEFLDTMKEFGLHNDNWNMVSMDSISIIAPRSNCVLSTIHDENPMNTMPSEVESLRKCLKKIVR